MNFHLLQKEAYGKKVFGAITSSLTAWARLGACIIKLYGSEITSVNGQLDYSKKKNLLTRDSNLCNYGSVTFVVHALGCK